MTQFVRVASTQKINVHQTCVETNNMENQIVSYQTLESPRKTGGLIAGVTLLVAAVAIYYLVNESRKADEEYLKKIKEAEASQGQDGSTDSYEELLDDPEYLSIDAQVRTTGRKM